MAPSLAGLSSPSVSNRVVIHVLFVTSAADSLALSPSLALLDSAFSAIPDNVAVLLSSDPQEAADFANIASSAEPSHVIHIFDYFNRAREVRKLSYPHLPREGHKHLSIHKALGESGYASYYYGFPNATDVFVVLNGTLGGLIKGAIQRSESGGVIVVRLLRPGTSLPLSACFPHPPSASKLWMR